VFEYRILGPLELRSAGKVVPLGGERQQTLLAVLLLNAGTVVSFDQLELNLWDRPPATARRQVANAAVAVRRAIGQGSGRLITTSYGYRLDTADDWLDVTAFRTAQRAAETAVAGHPADAVRLLQQALEVWRGPVLEGLDGDAVGFARHSLAEQRLAAVERLAGLRVELGEVTSVLGELSDLVAVHPLRESLRALLMRALHQVGRSADALAVFEQARQLLATELGVDPGPELSAMHSRILGAKPRPDAPPRGTWFLPGDTPDFTGRSADLDRLMAATVNGSPIVVVEGMGGVGKTELVVHLAHRLLDRFPDGQYFVDLRGFVEAEAPMSTDAALDTLLRQSGVPPEQLPADAGARRDLWRARVAGRRVLIVLDNAADAAQVQPLLPVSGGSLVLVTSRCQLVTLAGAVPVPLDVLDVDEARLLFRRIAGSDERVDADPGQVREIVGLCGRLPLAIRIAASRFRRRSTWTPRYLAEQLRDEHGRGRELSAGSYSVAGVIALSYRQLAPARQQLFRLLGLVPGPDFDAQAAAALTGTTVAAAAAGLEELLECNLLVQDTQARYRMHDLVRDCARDLAVRAHTEDELRVHRHRLFDYFLHLADVHCGPLSPFGPRFAPDLRYPPEPLPAAATREDDIQCLQAEFDNLVAVAEYTSAHGWHQHAWQLPCLMLPLFVRVGRRSVQLDLARQALVAARALGDRRGELLALTSIASALAEQDRDAELRETLGQVIAINRELGDLAGVATALRELGTSLLQSGELDAAEATITEARALARTAGDRTGEAALVLNLAVVKCNLGRYHDAARSLREVLEFYRRSGSVEGETIALVNLGWVGLLRDDDDAAMAALRQALRLSRQIGYARPESYALAWLSVTHRRLGRFADAIACAEAALDVARRNELGEPECEALNALGEAYLAGGALREASSAFENAERLAWQRGLPMERGRAWEGLAHLATGLDRARRLWERALACYPAHALEAQYSRAHLAAPGDRQVVCMRCRSRPHPIGLLASAIDALPISGLAALP
jgi:DNA-binding SARP family transcriptional activator/tetratricopeptide (TPR) repeat protein